MRIRTCAKALFVASIGLWLSNCVISEIPQDEGSANFMQDKPNLRSRPNTDDASDDDRAMGAACTPNPKKLAREDCPLGLICLPHGANPEFGTCMIECGQKIADRLEKHHEKCPDGLRCLMHSDAGLSPIGMFCAKGDIARNHACMAPLDNDACTKGLTCLPTEAREVSVGRKLLSHYRCKEECSVERLCVPSAQCTYPSYARKERQPAKKQGAMLTCDVKQCAANESSCPCDKKLNYACENLLQGIDIGFCVRMLGICENSQ